MKNLTTGTYIKLQILNFSHSCSINDYSVRRCFCSCWRTMMMMISTDRRPSPGACAYRQGCEAGRDGIRMGRVFAQGTQCKLLDAV